MKLYVVRHAIALDREIATRKEIPDEKRPLTKKGEKQFKELCKLLHKRDLKIDLLLVSPLKRAQQTAKIFHKKIRCKAEQEVEWLKPETPAALTAQQILKASKRLKGDATIAIVGHEPHLSELLMWYFTGDQAFAGHKAKKVKRQHQQQGWIEFKKGAVACLKFSGAPQPGRAKLEWLMTP